MGNQDRSTESSAAGSASRGRRRAATADTADTASAVSDGETAQQAGPESATETQLEAAPDSTAAQVASGGQDPDGGSTGNGSSVDPDTVATPGRDPLDPDEQARTGAPSGATGPVVTDGQFGGGASAQQISDAVARQHEGLDGDGEKIVFNVTRNPVVIDAAGHVLDAKGRRRMATFDAVTAAALRRGDLIDES